MLGRSAGLNSVKSKKNLRDLKDFDDTRCDEEVFRAGQERGVSNARTVVVYDGGKMLFATRLWCALTLCRIWCSGFRL